MALAGLLLSVWPLAQQISTRELQQEIQFYTEPYIPVAPTQVRRNAFLVDADVVVRDAEGRTVPGLTRRDFKIYDDGRQQTITNFSVAHAPAPLPPAPSLPASGASSTPPVAPPPRYVALFFDDRANRGVGTAGAGQTQGTSPYASDSSAASAPPVGTSGQTPGAFRNAGPLQGASFADLVRPRSAAEEFVQDDLRGRDEVGVFTASGSVSLAFTADRAKLLAAIRSIRWEPLVSTYGRDPFLVNIVSQFTLGNLRSAIARLARMPGSRLLVLISSGFTTRSLELRREVAELTSDALNAGVVVSAVDSKGLTTRAVPTRGAFAALAPAARELEPDDVMSELARDTGGTFFHNNNDLLTGLRETAALPQVSYRLAFAPGNLKEDGRFHSLKVKVLARGSFQVQARRGYFAPSLEARQAQAALDRFHQEAIGSGEIAEIPARVDAEVGVLASGAKAVQVSMRLDPKALSFRDVRGRHVDALNILAALLDSRGKCVAGERGLAAMELRKGTLSYLSERGIDTTLVVPAPAGSYRLRVVIEDTGSGKLLATSRLVAIP